MLEHLEALLHSSQARASAVSYVRTLAGAFGATKDLVAQLTAMTPYKGALLSSHILEDIFASFLENNRFEDAEAKCLQKLLHAMSTEFMQGWQIKKAQRRTTALSMAGTGGTGVTNSAVGYATSMTTTLLNAAASAGRSTSPEPIQNKTAQQQQQHLFISSDLTISFFDALEESEARIRLICLPDRVYPLSLSLEKESCVSQQRKKDQA